MLEYEIQVAGPIGPVVASIFPRFSVIALSVSTVLSGTVADADELLSVMTFLATQGFSPFDPPITAVDGPVSTADQVRHQEGSSTT